MRNNRELSQFASYIDITDSLRTIGVKTDLSANYGVAVGGTVTFEDVTNVDSIGIITARSGIELTGGNVTLGTGTTISSPASNEFAISTNGSERVRVGAGGSIGIGTDNPTKDLHISQNSDVAIRMHSGNCNTNARSWEVVVGGNASNNAEMVFRTRNDAGTGGSEAARFTASGNLAFPSGQGIDFSATANSSGTMSSELFDDYEEGTWTPTIVGTTTDPTITYSSRSGRYTKIGNQVTIWCFLQINTVSGGSGAVNLGGLPFTNASAAPASEGATFAINYYTNWNGVSSGNFPTGYVRNNDDKIYIVIAGTGASVTTYPVTSLNNSLLVYGCATYFANT